MNEIFDKLEYLEIGPLDSSKKRLPATQEGMQAVEKNFGYPIPASYINFSIRYGASVFLNNDWVFFKIPEFWNDKTDYSANDIRVFYGIEKENEFGNVTLWDLRWEIERARADGLPPHFLPICESDGLPTVIYISCQEQDYGHVYALTRTQIWNKMNQLISTDEVSKAAFHIADSFENFVDCLHVETS